MSAKEFVMAITEANRQIEKAGKTPETTMFFNDGKSRVITNVVSVGNSVLRLSIENHEGFFLIDSSSANFTVAPKATSRGVMS